MPAGPNCCCLKGSVPYCSNPLFLIFDIRALWRSVLSARVPECQKLKMVGYTSMVKCKAVMGSAVKGLTSRSSHHRSFQLNHAAPKQHFITWYKTQQTRTYFVTTRVRSRARAAARRRYGATRYRRIDHLRTTLASQLVKTHLPARRTFAAMTRLLTLVSSTRQFVYK